MIHGWIANLLLFYMKVECVLVEDNYDLNEKTDFFQQLEVDDN
jgi:hypothetical protein